MAVLFIALANGVVFAQFEKGELRVSVTDATGLALPSSLTLVSEASRTKRESNTNDAGQFTFQHLPFGVYQVTVEHAGFNPYSTIVEIRTRSSSRHPCPAQRENCIDGSSGQ